MDEPIQLMSFAGGAIALIGAALMVILHVALAQSVANDIDRLHTDGRESRFFDDFGWAFTTLITGLFGMAFYWVVHHSNLRDPASDRRLPGRE